MSENKELSTNVMPDLDDLEEELIPLSSQYWEPRKDGVMQEFRGVFLGFSHRNYDRVDEKTGEVTQIELECADFSVQLKNKQGEKYWDNFHNGATLLVDAIHEAVDKGRIIENKTPLKVEYTGLRRTGKGNSMDKFRITVLRLK